MRIVLASQKLLGDWCGRMLLLTHLCRRKMSTLPQASLVKAVPVERRAADGSSSGDAGGVRESMCAEGEGEPSGCCATSGTDTSLNCTSIGTITTAVN
jgi:hypothetical protein